MKPHLPLLFILSALSVAAQPTIQWQKSLGGTAFEHANSIQITSDGGYVMAGRSDSNNGDATGSHGGNDFWVVKMNSTGSIDWKKCLGGNYEDYGESIQQTQDGGYFIVGESTSTSGQVTGNHGLFDYWVVKTDPMGVITWEKSLGGSDNDYPVTAEQTKDGGFIIGGSSYSTDGDVSGNHGNSDGWVVKLNSAGSIEWQKSFGGSAYDIVFAVKQTVDKGYILAGTSSSNDGDVSGNHGGDDFWVVKIDSVGSIQWQKSLGGSKDESAFAILQTTDGGYIAAGIASSDDGNLSINKGSSDYWIVKLDVTGNIQWQKSFGGSKDDTPFSIQQTLDGGYIVAGSSFSTDGDVTGNHNNNQATSDAWIVKLNPSGSISWEQSYGGSSNDEADAIQQTSDGGYIFCGFSFSNNGDVSGNHGLEDLWVVKLSPVTAVKDDPNETGLTIFPNPAVDHMQVRIDDSNPNVQTTLIDVLGRPVLVRKMKNDGNIDVSNLPPGVYIVQVMTGDGKMYENKIVKR
jgi:hypothetical protein